MVFSSPINRSRITRDDSSISASGRNSVSARDSKYWLTLASSNGSFISNGSINGSSTTITITKAAAVVTVPSVASIFNLRSNSNSGDACNNIEEVAVIENDSSPQVLPPKVSSQPTTTTTTTSMKLLSQRIVKEEVCEHQRYQIVLGWGSKGHLLPIDPGKYTRRVVRKPPPSRLKNIRTRSPGSHRSSASATSATATATPTASSDGTSGTNGNGDDDIFKVQDMEVIHSPIFPDISLPKVQTTITNGTNSEFIQKTGRGKWEWISPWHLECPLPFSTIKTNNNTKKKEDVPEDPDGWQYASSFYHFDLENPQLTSWTPKPKFHVRRRKWIRYRHFVPFQSHNILQQSPSSGPVPVPVSLVPFPPLATTTTQQGQGQEQSDQYHQEEQEQEQYTHPYQAFDDCFLDSMSGWLKKMGHVRKNWKKRFFVLEKSILRYFTDENQTKLKGEVLLFHPATKVHYVDIHVSEKENTFMIKVGEQYHLLLEASSLVERENWMYCIEDALLCRDSYRQYLFYELQQQQQQMDRTTSSLVNNLEIVTNILEKLHDCRESVTVRCWKLITILDICFSDMITNTLVFSYIYVHIHCILNIYSDVG
jgi:hypothetical protein